MMFDRQKIILVSTKYISYFINIVIIMALVGGIYYWIQLLIQAAK
ncbi:MAG TPA: hypothetical protein V6C52_08710 [Coleofasciculaceae cyanobacterium]